jgi:RNA polymerase sigma factor (sigma-70 family)
MTVHDRDTEPSALAPALAAAPTTIAVVAGLGRPDDDVAFVLATYDAHHRELANFVRGIERDRDTADDIVSEAFVRLIEETRRGRTPEQPRAWLYRVAANLAIDRGRRRTVVTRVLGRLVDHGTEPAPDDEVLRGETRREVRAALSRLPVDARTALLLAAHGFSGRDIAEALGRSELATRSLICRARLRLREQLGGSEVPT